MKMMKGETGIENKNRDGVTENRYEHGEKILVLERK